MSHRGCLINAPEPSKFAVDPAAENENVTPYAPSRNGAMLCGSMDRRGAQRAKVWGRFD